MLNEDLIEKQALSDDDVQLLHSLHTIKKVMFGMTIEDLPVPVEDYVQAMQELEFEMQRVWGFDQNSAHHQHWFRDPKCDCPYLDNLDLIGIPRAVISERCKLHGTI